MYPAYMYDGMQMLMRYIWHKLPYKVVIDYSVLYVLYALDQFLTPFVFSWV